MKFPLQMILTALFVCVGLSNCKKASVNSPYQYFPMHLNNEWVYAVNDVRTGTDTLDVKVIGYATLSNDSPCWQMSYKDLYGYYHDTTYLYISGNLDTLLTYTDTNDSSLSEKWILANIKNNKWTGIDSTDQYYFQTPFDSLLGYGITYHNLWNIRRVYYHSIYSDVEQLYFEANVGLCSFSIDKTMMYGSLEQNWHLISYQLH